MVAALQEEDGKWWRRRRRFDADGSGSQHAERKHDGGSMQHLAMRPREVFAADEEGGIPSI